MRKTCVQTVPEASTSVIQTPVLSTADRPTQNHRGTKRLLIPLSLHNLCIQLYAGAKYKITDVIQALCTSSTALIIRTIPVKEEKLLYRNGG